MFGLGTKRDFKVIGKENFKTKTEKNYHRLFRILEKEFPGWVSIHYLNKKYGLAFLYESDFEELEKDSFLHKKTEGDPEELIKNRRAVMRNTYRLSGNGFMFLANMNSERTNSSIQILTIILTFFGVVQFLLILWQICLMLKNC